MNTDDAKFNEIIGLVRELQHLQQQAAQDYTAVVDEILLTQSRDIQRIEHTLDRLLDYCGHDSVLQLYKKLCRHYWNIDPAATADYVNAYREYWDSGTLKAGAGLSEKAIRDGYTRFKAATDAKELAAIAQKHGLATAALQAFVDGILDRMIFDGEQLGDLMAPLDLGWKARTQAELALMEELHPLLTKRAQGRDISGLRAYEQ